MRRPPGGVGDVCAVGCLLSWAVHGEVLLCTDPVDGAYRDPERFERGQSVVLPGAIGFKVTFDVDTLLDG